MRCRPPYLSVLTVFKTGSQAAVITSPFKADMSKNIFFFEVPVGTDPTTQLYKSRIFPVKLRDQFKTKNPGLLDPGLSLLYLMIRYIVLLNERHGNL